MKLLQWEREKLKHDMYDENCPLWWGSRNKSLILSKEKIIWTPKGESRAEVSSIHQILSFLFHHCHSNIVSLETCPLKYGRRQSQLISPCSEDVTLTGASSVHSHSCFVTFMSMNKVGMCESGINRMYVMHPTYSSQSHHASAQLSRYNSITWKDV